MTREGQENLNNKVITPGKNEKANTDALFAQLLARVEERKKDKENLLKLLEEIRELESKEQAGSNKEEEPQTEANVKTEEAPNDSGHEEEKEEESETDEDTIVDEAPATAKEYERLWNKLESIKPWQVWKIVPFIKTLIKFRSVEKKLNKEEWNEKMNDKYDGMSREELIESYKALGKKLDKVSMFRRDIYLPVKKEMQEIRKNRLPKFNKV